MNIAIISPWAISETSVGGTERFTIDLATQLLALGNSVEVFVLSGKSCHIQGINYTSLDVLGNGKIADEYDLQKLANENMGKSFYAKWASCLEVNIDSNKFDVIQLNSLLFIDAWPNKPRIFTIHTNPFEYQLDWGHERLDYVSRKIRKALPDKTLLTAPSEHYSRYFSKMFHRDVLTVPHAIDISRLNSTSATNRQSTAEHGITILLPSRLEPVQKRPRVVFCGVALLPEHLRKQITVVAGGKDPQYLDNCTKLERIAERNGFKAQFARFPSMVEAYAQADIVALPSKSESFGYSALESLALGIPTILNSLPTFKEIGAGNNNAYFFDQTAHAFSRTLLNLLGDLRSYPINESWSIRYDIQRWGKAYQKLARSVVGHE